MAGDVCIPSCTVEEDMSLLTKNKVECMRMIKTSVDDGYGGEEPAWTNGATFQAAIIPMSSTEIIAAAQHDAKATYNVLTDLSVTLMHDDIIRRISDGKLYRITQDGDDDKTPKGAGLKLRKVTAEELPALPM